MSSRRRGCWGEAGHRAGIWHFPKNFCQIPYPGQKCAVKCNLNPPPPGTGLWSQTRTKIQISLSPGQQDNSNALPPGQSERSNPCPMPRSTHPAGLTLIGAYIVAVTSSLSLFSHYLTIRLRAQVFYEQIVNEAQSSWLSLVENEGE